MAQNLSPEQERLASVEQGGVIAIAAAGSGKTEVASELFVRIYNREERAMFPRATERVCGKAQMRILRQITCLTFTVKAANEIDERIRTKFFAAGIPLPDENGRPYPLARTLDAYIRRWLRREEVFRAWMSTDTATKTRLTHVVGLLPVATRDALGCVGPEELDLYRIGRKWNWLADSEVADMLLDLSLRFEEDALLEGCDPRRWAWQYDRMLEGLNVDERGRLTHTFWEAPLAAWRRHQDRFATLDHALKQGSDIPDISREDALGIVKSWERYRRMREEFVAAHELARARGFHAVYAPERVTAKVVEDQLAASEYLKTYRSFLNIAERWHRLKTHFLLREFGDQTLAFVRACECYGELLERSTEYPRIVRTKHLVWDEVQDNTDLQHRILRMFFGTTDARGRKVPWLSVAIGDPRQQMYSWRGASPRGFLEMIERKRRKEPDNLLGLSCCFRSMTRIVDLGNEIVTTLPSYRDKVHPATAHYTEAGHIEVSRPFVSIEEEADWAFELINYEVQATTGTIMVLSRTDLSDHPLVFRRLRDHPELGKRISCMTIHAAKGLQADVVIGLGLVAGKVPDCRSHHDEEINVFYVLCTRARRALYLSGLMAKRQVNDHGAVEEQVVGPSPFFAKLPTLKSLCLKAGWTEALLRDGVSTHQQLIAAHLSRVDEERKRLRAERIRVFPEVELRPEDTGDLNDYGVTERDPMLALPRAQMGDNATGKPVRRMVSEKRVERLQAKLGEAYRLTRRVPRLDGDEFKLAIDKGWIGRTPQQSHWAFTQAFARRVDGGGNSTPA